MSDSGFWSFIWLNFEIYTFLCQNLGSWFRSKCNSSDSKSSITGMCLNACGSLHICQAECSPSCSAAASRPLFISSAQCQRLFAGSDAVYCVHGRRWQSLRINAVYLYMPLLMIYKCIYPIVKMTWHQLPPNWKCASQKSAIGCPPNIASRQDWAAMVWIEKQSFPARPFFQTSVITWSRPDITPCDHVCLLGETTSSDLDSTDMFPTSVLPASIGYSCF